MNSIIQNSPFLKAVETGFTKIKQEILILAYSKKKEPKYNHWIYYSALIIAENNNNKTSTHGKHSTEIDTTTSFQSLSNNSAVNILKGDKNCLKSFCETLVLVKEFQNRPFFHLNEKYISLAETQIDPCVPLHKKHSAFTDGMKIMMISLNPSAFPLRLCWLSPHYKHNINHCMTTVVYFLSIQYICRDVELFIEIPQDYFVQKNEILSAEFVKRWLDYNEGTNIPFDMSYRLEIIDRDITQFTLTSTQYIVLEANTYHIMKRQHHKQGKTTPSSPFKKY